MSDQEHERALFDVEIDSVESANPVPVDQRDTAERYHGVRHVRHAPRQKLGAYIDNLFSVKQGGNLRVNFDLSDEQRAIISRRVPRRWTATRRFRTTSSPRWRSWDSSGSRSPSDTAAPEPIRSHSCSP